MLIEHRFWEKSTKIPPKSGQHSRIFQEKREKNLIKRKKVLEEKRL